jgi:ATP-dependent RNA helicase DDX49/DBP8
VESETLTVKGLKQEYLFLPAHARDPYLYYLLTHPPKSIKYLRHRQAVDEEREREMGGRPSKKRKQTEEERAEEEALKNIPSTIIFTQRCTTAHLLHLILTELEIPSVPLHSHLTQPQRLDSLAQFRAGTVPVLVTTDVGSRGLDIPEVALVINWDCPRTGPDYVHRVGRTARAGRGGLAVTIVTERDVDLVKGIEDMTSEFSHRKGWISKRNTNEGNGSHRGHAGRDAIT